MCVCIYSFLSFIFDSEDEAVVESREMRDERGSERGKEERSEFVKAKDPSFRRRPHFPSSLLSFPALSLLLLVQALLQRPKSSNAVHPSISLKPLKQELACEFFVFFRSFSLSTFRISLSLPANLTVVNALPHRI